MKFRTFAFFDLETTGIPSLERTKTRITELSIVACPVDHLKTTTANADKLPRVLQKLNVCLNPRKIISPGAEAITHLNNYVLENMKRFDENTGNLIKNFLAQLEDPICFVAHNGNDFDFPLLKQELDDVNAILPENIYCVDSLEAFREIDYPDEDPLPLATTSNTNPEIQPPITLNPEIQTTSLIPTEDFETNEQNALSIDEILEQNDAINWQKLNESTPKSATGGQNKRPSKRANLLQSRTNKTEPTSTVIKRDDKRKSTFARRKLFPEKYKKGKYTLEAIFERSYGKKPEQSHYAEADVLAMLQCVVAKKEQFIDFVEKEAQPFNSVEIPWRK